MAQGKLEVLLVKAKDLERDHFFSHMDPYCILTCRTQEKKSKVASGQGTHPEWNETFLFNISSGSGSTKLRIKIMDKDTFTKDDYLGEATIYLKNVLEVQSVPPMSYRVVKDERYCGEIKLGLKFTPYQKNTDCEFGEQKEELGGWKQSSFHY